jgi:16S rRNA processing protein RimM
MIAPEGWVWLARIKRTQGRKGEVFAEILTDFPEKFAERRRLWLLCSDNPGAGGDASHRGPSDSPREVGLVHHWLHKGGVVLHFAGVDSISDAEKLAGLIVAIPRAERAQLDEGGVYIGDLIGCVLVDVSSTGESGGESRVVGEIEDVDRSAGPVAMLVVRGNSAPQPVGEPARQSERGDEILIPFAKDYLRRVDLDAKRVEMALPEGLVDLNETNRSSQS